MLCSEVPQLLNIVLPLDVVDFMASLVHCANFKYRDHPNPSLAARFRLMIDQCLLPHGSTVQPVEVRMTLLRRKLLSSPVQAVFDIHKRRLFKVSMFVMLAECAVCEGYWGGEGSWSRQFEKGLV